MQPVRRVFTSTNAAAASSVRKPGAFTCGTCLQRRAFSGSAPRFGAPAGPSRAGIAQLASRRLISLSGPDAAKYLQGVITANLYPGSPTPSSEHLRTDAGFYAAFLTAQGRVLHDVFVYHDARDTSSPAGHSWLVEVDAAEADRLQKHLKRYKLRAKFDVRLLDDGEARVWQAWDDSWGPCSSSPSRSTPSPVSHLTTENNNNDSKTNTTIITTPDTRAPNLGHRILTFNNPPNLETPQVPESAYTLRRYLHGVPEGQAELLFNQALPHESNMDHMHAIDFRKGCYVGQELTIRTEHRGVVRKRVLPCLLYPDDQPPPQALEYQSAVGAGGFVDAERVPAEASIGRVGKKGRSAGKWLRGVGNLGLALCRLEIMTGVVLPGETGGVGFSEGDEFVVGLAGEGERADGQGEGEEGGKVKIKAFVPEWLRSGLASREGH